MPHVVVKMYPGRSEEVKQALVDAIVSAVMTHTKNTEAAVSVSIEEVPRERWTADVYEPDITGKPDTLYKKPGYQPF